MYVLEKIYVFEEICFYPGHINHNQLLYLAVTGDVAIIAYGMDQEIAQVNTS